MAFIPVEETAMLQPVYQIGSKQVTNTLYFQQGASPVLWTEADLTELCNAALETWEEIMVGSFTTVVELVAMRATSLQTVSSPSVIVTPSSTLNGTLTGDPTVLHSAVSITFRTAKRGRAYRGRIYHYGLSTGQLLDEKTWTAVTVAATAENYGEWFAAMAAAFYTGSVPLQHVQVSRQIDNAPRITGEVTVVTDIVGRQPMATQRRRVKP